MTFIKEFENWSLFVQWYAKHTTLNERPTRANKQAAALRFAMDNDQ